MKKSLIKDSFREIKKSFGRFISIFCIVAIGVAFFAGVKIASPDMKNTADKYYDDYNFMDIQIISNLGLTSDDINELRKLDYIENVKGTYSKDVLTSIGKKEYVMRVHSININDIDSNKDYINKPKIIEGRYPKNDKECLVEYSSQSMGIPIDLGEKINLYGDNEEKLEGTLKNSEYTVVGKVQTPYYVSHQKGSSNIGNGQLNSFIMVSENNFKDDIYTEGYVTLKGAKELPSYSDEYKDAVESNKTKLEAIGKERASLRYGEIVNEARSKIQEAKNEIEDKKKDVNKQISDAKDKIDNGKKDIENGENKLKENKEKLNNSILEGNLKLESEEKNLTKKESELNSRYNEFILSKPSIEEKINSSKKEIDNGYKGLEQQKKYLDIMENNLASGNLTEDEAKELEKKIKETKEQISAVEEQLDISSKKLNNKIKELNEAQKKFESSFALISSGKEEIKSQRQKLLREKNKALSEFENAKEKIEASKEEIKKGEKDYEASKKKAIEEFEKADNEIAQKEREIKDLKKGEWYVLDRNANYGFVDYGNSAESINSIAKLFPIFFFLVAALICLTTMTRMVDEQRGNIGTLKALGYSKASIAYKYISYATFASIGGSILGLLIGLTLFPTVIFNAYSTMTYSLPKVILGFDIKLAIISTAIAILTTTLSALFACYKELMETPSLLMRPKAPKQGKRIFIERIPFIWKKLNFTQKVTARNIFRYKKRFFMTVIGISGCTALLLSGFGIKDSITGILNKQYGNVFKYNGVINYKVEVLSNEVNKDIEEVAKDKRIKDYANVKVKNMDIFNKDKKVQSNIFVMEDTKKIKNFINIKNRKTGTVYNLSDNGVVITEKLAKILEVKIGDSIFIENKDKNKYSVKIEGIAENYVSHYMYMTPKFYENLFKDNMKYNQVLIKTEKNSKDIENAISQDIMKNNNINSISFNSTITESFSKMISNLNYVVLLMIASAGALAFIVLYNLNNVNISERIKEIATIKVLGFYDNEVSKYVFRENIILTIIGTLLGLVLGVFMHRFIMVTAELESIMFGRNINFYSYILAAILTLTFAAIVNLFMYFKLKKVKMVESLKSVD